MVFHSFSRSNPRNKAYCFLRAEFETRSKLGRAPTGTTTYRRRSVARLYEDLFSGVLGKLPVDIEPKNPTMGKKLVITAAPCGSYIGREQNPYQPFTPEEVSRAAIEAYDAGASVWHVHVRYADGFVCKDPNIIRETIDMVLDERPDVIISNNVSADWREPPPRRISPVVEPLMEMAAASGRKYIDTVVITASTLSFSDSLLWVMTDQMLKTTVEYVQGRGLRCEFQLHDYGSIERIKRHLIDTGLLQKPAIMNLILGFHSHFVTPSGPDPWGQINMMSLLQQMPEGVVVGATVGGRNWLPLTVGAIMQGVDCVRVGMEDAIWMYPHKDEKIRSAAEVVHKVATIAKELGREIATPAETRKLWGLS